MNTKNHQNSIDTSNIQITDDSSTSEESPDTHFIIEMSSGKIGGANIRLENVQQENNLIDYTNNHFMSLTQRDLDKVRTNLHEEDNKELQKHIIYY